MPTYIVFINRKKRHEETLNQYYQATVLGTFNAPNVYKAIKGGAIHFNIGQSEIDAVAYRNAIEWQQKIAMQKKSESEKEKENK